MTFTSFGFKHGPLRDADLVFDVRFLPNPHYVDELRPLTGRDPRVVEYVARDGKLDEFYERLHALLDFLLPQYVLEGKAHLTIAIGCTGGRHRSVAIAEHLGRALPRRRTASRSRSSTATSTCRRARRTAAECARRDRPPRVRGRRPERSARFYDAVFFALGIAPRVPVAAARSPGATTARRSGSSSAGARRSPATATSR